MYVTAKEMAAVESPEWQSYWSVGERLPASYVNFYITNKAVVVPQFNQPNWDEAALQLLDVLFPGREVIGVKSKPILLGGGNIHCITQQVPLCENVSP